NAAGAATVPPAANAATATAVARNLLTSGTPHVGDRRRSVFDAARHPVIGEIAGFAEVGVHAGQSAVAGRRGGCDGDPVTISAKRWAVVLTAVLLTLTQAPAPASAAPAVCDAPVPSTTRPGVVIADPDCDISGTPFTALPGAVVHTGIQDGAAYRIEVPDDWNGRLVLYAHGYRG